MSVYNSEQFLSKSIESILNQRGVDLEFIIINDGSTDKSSEILAKYAAQDSRIRVYEQANQGLTKALIRGCREARGEVIARQDDDDISLTDRLAALSDLLRTDSRLVMASSWSYAFGPCGELIYEVRRPADPVQATYALLNQSLGPPGHGSVMFRRTAYQKVGGYREQFYYAQDSDLWLRLCEIGLIGYCQQLLYAYSFRESAISFADASVQRQLGSLTHACRAARLSGGDETAYLTQATSFQPPFTRHRVSRKYAGLFFLAGCLRQRCDPRARIYYWRIVRQQPYAVWAWLGLLDSFCRGRWNLAKNVTAKGLLTASS